jgi:hypothetical protein
MGLLRAPYSWFNLTRSPFLAKIKFTWFTLVYTGLYPFAPRCTNGIFKQIIMPYDVPEIQGVSFPGRKTLYWNCTHNYSVCHVYVHVQVVYKSKFHELHWKADALNFQYIIGHNNLLDDVICLWHVCAIARFCAIWCRIAFSAAFRNMFNTGTCLVWTSTYTVCKNYWLNDLYCLKTYRVHTVYWLLRPCSSCLCTSTDTKLFEKLHDVGNWTVYLNVTSCTLRGRGLHWPLRCKR